MAGVILLVLLAVLGVTILRIGQLIWIHLFLGLVLLGPVAAKMASTGYKLVRYYARAEAYSRQGPPELLLRVLGPFVAVSTILVFASGVVLLARGPAARGIWVGVHKASFVAWLVLIGLHVLGHLTQLPMSLRAVRADTGLAARAPGATGRWIALSGALVGGLVIAVALMPQFAAWTSHFVGLDH